MGKVSIGDFVIRGVSMRDVVRTFFFFFWYLFFHFSFRYIISCTLVL